MLVKAKWNVKGSDGWHFGGEVFETEEDFGEAVEVLDNPVTKPAAEKAEKPEKASAKKPENGPGPVKEEPKAEKTKTASRRRTTAM